MHTVQYTDRKDTLDVEMLSRSDKLSDGPVPF